MSIPSWIVSLLRPIPVTIGVLGSAASIVAANYDFRTADISPAVIEVPSNAQLQKLRDHIANDNQHLIDVNGNIEKQVSELVQSKKYRVDYMSYKILVSNYSDIDANSLRVKIAGYADGHLVLNDFLHGQHTLPANTGHISADIPLNEAYAEIDEFAFCISYRGRYLINSVRSTIRLAQSPSPSMPDIDLSGYRSWGEIGHREKNDYVFGNACDNWPERHG